MRRIVFETTVGRRVVTWGNYQTISKVRIALRLALIVVDDGHRYCRGWNVSGFGIHHCDHVVACQYFKCGLLGWAAQRMGIFAHVDRSVNILGSAVFNDCLSDGRNVIFVERAIQAGATVTRCSKGDLLFGGRDIGVDFKIGRKQLLNVD